MNAAAKVWGPPPVNAKNFADPLANAVYLHNAALAVDMMRGRRRHEGDIDFTAMVVSVPNKSGHTVGWTHCVLGENDRLAVAPNLPLVDSAPAAIARAQALGDRVPKIHLEMWIIGSTVCAISEQKST